MPFCGKQYHVIYYCMALTPAGSYKQKRNTAMILRHFWNPLNWFLNARLQQWNKLPKQQPITYKFIS